MPYPSFAMTRRSLDIIYNSDVMISDPEQLASLAIFYDRVVLPATTPTSSRYFIEFERLPSDVLHLTANGLANLKVHMPSGKAEQADEFVIRWDGANRDLLEEQVIVRLSEPSASADVLADWLQNRRTLAVSFGDLLHYRTAVFVTSRKNPQLVYVRQDHLRHLLRSDLTAPAVFAGPATSRREVLKVLGVLETFRYFIPCVGTLRPAEILAVREKVRATREGFAMHMQSLSAEIEARIKGGEMLSEIARYARAVVETSLIPDYYEFKRQLMAERSGFWLKVLEASRKVFEIEVPPWTPKFYGEILAALGVSFLTSAEARREALSNRSQAYQFMSQIEEASSLAGKTAG